jgi:ketosteroid isomerase-like protein
VEIRPPDERSITSTNGSTIQAMWLSHREGRIDDMLELLHPDIIWWPMSRPGRVSYSGRDEILQMLADIRSANGNHWIELDDIVEVERNLISARGRVVTLDAEGEPISAVIEMLMTMRDGLVHRVETGPLTTS